MVDTLTMPPQPNRSWLKFLVPAALLLLLLTAFFALRALSNLGNPSDPDLFSLADFEEQHGLQVRLVGVSAGGGMIDFRLKATNAQKARQFFQDGVNLPISLVLEDGRELLAADSIEDNIIWEDDKILFILMGNSEGVIQPGTPVFIKFGELMLEPIRAQ